MNKKIILLILSVLSFGAASAQVASLLLWNPDNTFKSGYGMVSLGGDAFIGSTVLDNAFMSKLAFGGFISDEDKKTQLNRFSGVARNGAALTGNLDFYGFQDSLFGKANIGLRIGISSNYAANVQFTQALFESVFYGNRPATDLDLGAVYGEYQVFQKFGVGFFNKHNFSGAMISLVSGDDYARLDMRHAGMKTSAQFDSLTFTYNGDFVQSNPDRSGWGNGNGLGVAVDFDINQSLFGGRGMVSLSARNLGFVRWGNNTEQYHMNGSTTWTGYDLNNLLQLNTDTLSFPNIQDTLAKRVQLEKDVRMLPATIHFRFMKRFRQRHFYEAGFTIQPNLTAVPLGYVGLAHYMGKNIMIHEEVTLGGYNKWTFGAGIQWMPKNKWLVKVGSRNLPGLFLSGVGGMGLNFSLAYFIPTLRQSD